MEKTPLDHALDVNSSIFIQACAGAGKTFALTKRYAAILDSFAREALLKEAAVQSNHKEILVITFTKKAATEMAERIQEDINILLSGKEIPELRGKDFCPTLRKERGELIQSFVTNLKNAFSRNSISTIDSFCGSLLKEFAHKLKLDPQFSMQEDSESQRFLDESLTNWLKLKAKEDPHIFDLLLEELSFSQIRRALRTLYLSREILDEYSQNIEEGSEEELWKIWLQRYTPLVDISELARKFEKLCERADSLCTNHDDALYNIIDSLCSQYRILNPAEPLEFKAAFLSSIGLSGFLTKDKRYKERFPGRQDNWTDKKEEALVWFELLKNTISAEDLIQTPGEQDKKIIPLLKKLLFLYRDFHQYYSERKSAKNVLDFSDVIIKTHELLSRFEDVRKQVAKRYRHIMLDEFQDTNPKRWDIIKMIFDAGEDIRLFIVGDRKQSIYRFNYADVTVMNKAEDLLRELQGKILDFNDNYRSSDTFVKNVINPLFSKIFPARKDFKEAYEADFEPTQAMSEKLNISPAIEMHWCNTPEEKDDSNYSALHAAEHVKNLLEKYEGSDIDKEGKPLIGVLFRRFTNIDDYLRAFRQHNISFSIIGGKGFYNTAPLQDIFNFLCVLENPFDDHALIALLRSPFIALPDNKIHLLSQAGHKRSSLFTLMKEHAKLQKSRELILSWREAAGKMPLDELITDILDSEERELGYISELLAEQQLANMDKAVNIIRAMQRKGNSLREIREFFYYQSMQDTREAQALYPGTAKVHLLTIHKAKGLAYPIVLVPEMNSRGNVSKDNVRFGRSGDNAEISLSLPDQEKPGLLLLLNESSKREEEAEEKRIFYVALTRAMYKVCLLAEGKGRCAKNTDWYKFVLEPHALLDAEDKALSPEEWPEELIQQGSYEELEDLFLPSRLEEEWQELPERYEGGSYLYRSPHDLMGDSNIPEAGGSGIAGMALGLIYHYCIEQRCFDLSLCREEVEKQIPGQIQGNEKEEILKNLEILLQTTKKHKLYQILTDEGIEKYQELSLKGWLKKDEDIVQVNGIIDLLYCENGEWVVLDFKTDRTKERLPFYEKQLMSYQWMLKQAYGIEAKAQIFFVALEETLDIPWKEDYFDGLPIGRGFRPALPRPYTDASALAEHIREGEYILFCNSAHQEEQIFLSLLHLGKMRPNIYITTLKKWLHSFPLKSTSQDRLRLIIQKADKNLLPGTIDYLAKAFREHEMQDAEILKDFSHIYVKIKNKASYIPANLPYREAEIPAARIIFIDMAPMPAAERELTERLRLKNSYMDFSLLPRGVKREYDLIEAFSPREEVLAVAKHILESRVEKDGILITVASMEKYAPHLKRLFPQMGLQLRFTDNKPLKEYPLTVLVLNLIHLSSINKPQWQDLAPILLHPLLKAGPGLWSHDKKVRNEPWEEQELPKEARGFLDTYCCKGTEDLQISIERFIRDYHLDSVHEDDSVCKKILDILSETMQDLQDIFDDFHISDVYREVKIRIEKAGLPRKNQPNGIRVVGFLDSLGAVPQRLYVMGMVEGDIPRPEDENPYLQKREMLSLELNRHFMQYWEALGEPVVFSLSRHAEDGSEQNPSGFLQDLNLRKIDYSTSRSVSGWRSSLLKYENRCIKGADTQRIQRHNEIVSGSQGNFSGKVDEIRKEYRLSVTSVDALLACPMRFYYDVILNLRPMDEVERKYYLMLRGSVIHKSLEYFLKKKGFSLPLEDAVPLLEECLYRVFEEEKINIEDPFQKDLFRNYIRRFDINSNENGLVKFLKNDKSDFGTYEEVNAEEAFKDFHIEYEDLDLYLKGRVDKILRNSSSKKMLVVDYKTGEIQLSDMKKMLLSQLYLYMKKYKTENPEHELEAAYEIIAHVDKTKNLIFGEEDGNFVQRTSRKANPIFSIEEFEEDLKALFLQIARGEYYLTSKAFRDVCTYCPHESLCRKNTRIFSAL